LKKFKKSEGVSGLEKSRLFKLTQLGQEVWHDDLYRGLIVSGELAQMIEVDGLSGVTSNPTIFDNAISSSTDYDKEIGELTRQGKKAKEIYTQLTKRDVQLACDVLKPVYEKSNGAKGYVSLEVNPHIADDEEATISEAKKLAEAVGKPNLMIKVPGTPAGVNAFRKLTAQGYNINVTLLFSLKHYQRIAQAYLAGLKERLEKGEELSSVRSVASFFLSRIDKVIDKKIDEMAASAGPKVKEKLSRLRGQTAIATAHLVYASFKDIFSSPEFTELQRAGAVVQKPLWASSSTKDPTYSDVKYVEALIFPQTVITMPMVTVKAFRDHGQAQLSQLEVSWAKGVLEQLNEYQIDLEEVCENLQAQGAKAFADSYDHLLQTLNAKSKVF
jgi:transaldolase